MNSPEKPVQQSLTVADLKLLLIAMGWLAAVVSLALFIDVIYVIPAKGRSGAVAAGVAAGICWISSVLALVLTVGLARTELKLAGALGGILFRTLCPLAAMAAGNQVRWLAVEGFAGQVVVFFLVSLAAETILATWVSSRMLNLDLWR